MSILNGLRKAFTTTPAVPSIPSGTTTPQQETEFLNAYRGFANEIEQYKKTVNKDNVPSYYKEVRFEQYEDFKKGVAGFVKTIADTNRFVQKVLEIDGTIALHLLDRKDCLKHILRTSPTTIKTLPQSYQEDPELAEVIVEYNVGKVQHLPLKFRNDPEFMYRCLADKSKFEPVGPFLAKYHPHEVIDAIGSELNSKLPSPRQYDKVLSDLKALVEAESQAKIMGQQFSSDRKANHKQMRVLS